MKIKLLFAGLLTPALAFTSNAIIYPGAKIVDGVFDLYRNKPFRDSRLRILRRQAGSFEQICRNLFDAANSVKFTVT